MEIDTWLAAAHALAWCAQVGGSLTMEWVLRFAQRTMPGPQTGVVCQRAGTRYRWFALASLAVVGVTGLLMTVRLDDPELALTESYGRTFWALVALWTVLTIAVALMAFVLHPAQRRRSLPDATEDDVKRERARLGRAIARMEFVLRLELVVSIVAVALGASLEHGGML
jgi:uncharacterized membrane protein